MGKISKNKDSVDMRLENEKDMEKDEDKKALDDEIFKEGQGIGGAEYDNMRSFTGGND
jgi:hypothetical protein